MKILLMDSHRLLNEGLRHLLTRHYGSGVQVLESVSFADGMELIRQLPDLDLILLEPSLPGGDAVASVRRLQASFPHIPLLIISGEAAGWSAKEVLGSNVSGFVSKRSGTGELLKAMEHVLAEKSQVAVSRRRSNGCGAYGLTRRQEEIFRHMMSGLSNKEIALMTGLATGTIKTHMAAIYRALGIRRRVEAVRAASKLGFSVAF